MDIMIFLMGVISTLGGVIIGAAAVLAGRKNGEK